MTKESALKDLEEINALKQEALKNLKEIEAKEKEIKETIRQEEIKENEKKLEYIKEHQDIILPLIKANPHHVEGKQCRDSDYFDFERENFARCPRCLLKDILDTGWNDVAVTFALEFRKI